MNLFYKEYQPSEALKQYVVSYWSLVSDGKGNEQSELQRCFPAGTIEWIVTVRGRNMKQVREEGLFDYPKSIFTGICDKAAEWYGYGAFELFGIRFTPEGAIRLFNTPLNEFQNSYLDSESFLGSKINPIISNLVEVESTRERILMAETFLYHQIKYKSLERNYFTEAMKIIRTHDELNVSELSERVNICERQLQRTFKSNLGISPKSYYKVMRLYKAHQLGLMKKENYTNIAYHFGYSDPAHFTRDFKNYFGVPPEQHFSSIQMLWT